MSSKKRQNSNNDSNTNNSKKTKYSNNRKSRCFNVKKFQHQHEDDLKEMENNNLSDLQKVFQKKLEGAKFRVLNEQLYTYTSDDSKKMFSEDPSLFQDYHAGYSMSMKEWPHKPINTMINFVKKKKKNVVVGDFGCGEAELAKTVEQKVHSFDFIALNKHVTECDISKVPLEDESIDIAIFCLSLMGTNWFDFIMEAFRVLKKGGILKIAEVESRFIKIPRFNDCLEKMGFDFKAKTSSNGYFITFEFTKSKDRYAKKPNVDPNTVLKPCLYKKR
eukprot:gene5137-8743_t